MKQTGTDEPEPPSRRPAERADPRLARKAQALRANLKRRKTQSRERAGADRDDATAD